MYIQNQPATSTVPSSGTTTLVSDTTVYQPVSSRVHSSVANRYSKRKPDKPRTSGTDLESEIAHPKSAAGFQ